jgi:hypothetical protein
MKDTKMLENDLSQVMSLDGEWQIHVAGHTDPVIVPGTWERQGYPQDAERTTYTRTITVPSDWSNCAVYLRFGAVSYDAEVLVNGTILGRHEGLWTAFEFEVTPYLKFGAPNTIELRVVKPLGDGDSYPYREVLVGFIPYVAITFGGIWQSVQLVAHEHAAIDLEQLSANWRSGMVSVTARARTMRRETLSGVSMTAEVLQQDGTVIATCQIDANEEREFQLVVANPDLWSPKSPSLYTLRLRLVQDDKEIAETRRKFGFRELAAEGMRLLLNGEPISLRGILSWGWDPKTLAPTPSDVEICDEFRRVRALGFNMVKLCLFVPPQRLFQIADEEGMLLWLELPMWWQRMTAHLREQARLEYADILRAVHHHPSIVIYSLGCELGADMADAELLSALNTLARDTTSGVLICDNSGSGEAYEGLAVDYADFLDYHFYCDLHYFVPLLDHFRRDWRQPRPWIFGEYCDNDTYRDPAETAERGERPWWRDVLGVEGTLERWAYPEQEQRMAANALPFSDQQLKAISYAQALVVRKTILERTRARQEAGGYVLTGLRDTPISTSGIFDDAGRSKFDAEVFQQFNADNVLVLDHGRTRQWRNGGDRPAPLDLHNHWGGEAVTLRVILSHTTLSIARALNCRLLAPDGQSYWETEVRVDGLPPAGVPRAIGAVELALPHVEQAGEWRFEADLDGQIMNHWPLWIYPKQTLAHECVASYDPLGVFEGFWTERTLAQKWDGVIAASLYTSELRQYVERGGKAIVLQPGAGMLPTQGLPFWRESIKLVYDHPVMRAFPHQGYTNLQFYHLATDHAFTPSTFEGLAVSPVIRRLDARVFTLHDYLIEAAAGSGLMLASTLRFFGGTGDQVRSLGRHPAGAFLLSQMIHYVLESPS